MWEASMVVLGLLFWALGMGRALDIRKGESVEQNENRCAGLSFVALVMAWVAGWLAGGGG